MAAAINLRASCAGQNTIVLHVICQEQKEIPSPRNFMAIALVCKITKQTENRVTLLPAS